MRRRLGPAPISAAITGLMADVRPATPLARVQAAWPDAVGPAVAPHATAAALNAGVLEVTCDSAVWAQEVELLQGELMARLEARIGPGVVVSLRARTAHSRASRRRRDER